MAPPSMTPLRPVSSFTDWSEASEPPRLRNYRVLLSQWIQAPRSILSRHLPGRMEVNEIITRTPERRSTKRQPPDSPPGDMLPDADGGVTTGIPQEDSSSGAGALLTDCPNQQPKARAPRGSHKAAQTSSPLSTAAKHDFAPTEDAESLFLHSTPCTMTLPTFRHGRIKIPKPDSHGNMVPGSIRDWTSFQTAILGGAGDWLSGSSDFTRYSDDDTLEDLAEWFAGFGFQSAGRLVVETRPSAGARSTSTMHSHVRSVSSTSSGALPSHTRLPLSSREDRARWAQTSRGYASDRTDSPPESPMADLGFMRDGIRADFVLMGDNLNHDCPEFLNWTWQQISGVRCT